MMGEFLLETLKNLCDPDFRFFENVFFGPGLKSPSAFDDLDWT